MPETVTARFANRALLAWERRELAGDDGGGIVRAVEEFLLEKGGGWHHLCGRLL